MVMLDTSILIEHLRLSKEKSQSTFDQLLNLNYLDIYISVLSVQELFEGKSTLSKVNLEKLNNLLDQLQILSYNYDIAMFAGELARDLPINIGFVDCAIAATSMYYDKPLITLNKKHFSKIPNLKLLPL